MISPLVIESDMTLFVDVDNTLVSVRTKEEVPLDWQERGPLPNTFWLKISDEEYWVVYQKHIDFLKKSKLREHVVFVWSAGGHEWAKRVVDILYLNEWVDVVMSKPRWVVDDLPASVFIPEANRIYKYKENEE